MLEWGQVVALLGFAFLAGLIDSAVGGGGLIQFPALLIFLPTAPLATISGTNKLSSIFGTGTAIIRYSRHIKLDRQVVLPATIAAFILSYVGAQVLSLVDSNLLRPLILVLLILVAIYTFIKKDFGTLHAPKLTGRQQLWVSLATGAVIGFYDGFFGPGTGSFLIFSFIGFFGFGFLPATASAKVVNFATNLSALIYFVFSSNIIYALALPMAAANILGSLVGTRLAVTRGSRFVRVLFLMVVAGTILKVVYDTFHLSIKL